MARRRGSGDKRLLIVSMEVDPHADVMVEQLEKRGIVPVRFHAEALGRYQFLSVRPEASGDDWRWLLTTPKGTVTDREVASVWNRRSRYVRDEALDDDEADFAEMETRGTVLGAFRITDALWVNHPDDVRRAESKPHQLRLARELGFDVPRSLLTNDPVRARAFLDACRGRVVFKALTQGQLKVMDRLGIYTSPVTAEQIADAAAIRRAPCFFQEHIAKAFDLRVTVIGERVFAVEIHSQEDDRALTDWRRGDALAMPHLVHALPAAEERRCLDLMRALNLHYGAIDYAVTPDGAYMFLEINPSGQFGWIEGLTGLPLFETMADLLVEPLVG